MQQWIIVVMLDIFELVTSINLLKGKLTLASHCGSESFHSANQLPCTHLLDSAVKAIVTASHKIFCAHVNPSWNSSQPFC